MALPAVPGRAAVSLTAAVLRPVRDGNAFESTVEHLAMAIRLGVFAEGERLPPERELAELLRVGRATLREAIGALRQADMVRTRRGRTGGTVVVYRGRSPTGQVPGGRRRAPGAPTEVADVLAFRGVVEPGAARLAAAADLSVDQQDWLRIALRESLGIEDDGARRVADSRLHLAIATLSGSPRVVEAVSRARSSTADLLAEIPVLATNLANSDAHHAELVEAVIAGDQVRADVVMTEHCAATSALIRAFLG